MDSTWHFATVSDEGYIIRNFSDLANAVKDIVMSRTQLVRDSRTSNRYYFVNDLTHVGWLNGSGHFRQPMFRIDTEGARADVIRTIKHMVRRLRGYKIDGPLNLLGDKIHDNKIKGPKYEHDLNEYPLTGAPGSYNPPRDSEVKEPSAYEHTMTEHEMETSEGMFAPIEDSEVKEPSAYDHNMREFSMEGSEGMRDNIGSDHSIETDSYAQDMREFDMEGSEGMRDWIEDNYIKEGKYEHDMTEHLMDGADGSFGRIEDNVIDGDEVGPVDMEFKLVGNEGKTKMREQVLVDGSVASPVWTPLVEQDRLIPDVSSTELDETDADYELTNPHMDLRPYDVPSVQHELDMNLDKPFDLADAPLTGDDSSRIIHDSYIIQTGHEPVYLETSLYEDSSREKMGEMVSLVESPRQREQEMFTIDDGYRQEEQQMIPMDFDISKMEMQFFEMSNNLDTLKT